MASCSLGVVEGAGDRLVGHCLSLRDKADRYRAPSRRLEVKGISVTTTSSPAANQAKRESRMTIGEVAAHAGVNTSHIRYYEEVGVLPAAERVSGQRRYDEDVLHRLAIIDVAQRVGLTLDEIR